MAYIKANETSKERIRRFYPHIPEKDLDEIMLTMVATAKYGSKEVEFTREDLLVITAALYEKANDINGSVEHESKFTSRQIWDAVNKIDDVFRR